MAQQKGAAKKAQTKSKKTAQKPPVPPVDETPVAAADIPGTEPVPSPKDYLLAMLSMLWQWVRSHKLKFLTSVVLIVVIVGGLTWLLWPSPAALTNDEIVTRINQELSIQGDGNPAVLTVEDKSKATQPFLQGAENGDKVVLYYKAKKSVLYRPSEQRIIHEGAYTPPDAKVFIRRGTNDAGKVTEMEQKLDTIRDIEVISRDDSPRRDYSGITVVNVTDRYDDKAQELARAFGTVVVRLPGGETFPEADILIIVGN